MPKNKDNPQSCSQSATCNKSDHEFEGQGKKNFGGGQGQQAGGSKKGQGNMEDDEMTAGGRKGQFSEKDRGSDSQWSPGTSRSTDE